MPTIQISGPYLRQYPYIFKELKRLRIWHDTRYVEIVTKELTFRNSKHEPFGSMQYDPCVTAVLHSGEQVEIALPNTLPVLEHNPLPPQHNGMLSTRKYVEYNEKGKVHLNTRTLTASQALEMLEWLELERPALEKKVKEEDEQKLIS
jgi:hypothetical protein